MVTVYCGACLTTHTARIQDVARWRLTHPCHPAALPVSTYEPRHLA